MRFPNKFPDLFPTEAVKQFMDLVSQPTLVQGLKDAAQKLGIQDVLPTGQIQEAMQQAKRWMDVVAEQFTSATPGMNRVINGTGEIFSDRWAAVPSDSEILQAEHTIRSGVVRNVESVIDIPLVRKLTHAEDVWIASSVGQAILALGKLSSNGWIVPRTDCIRLPKSNGSQPAITELLGAFGKKVVEIGAANDCGRDDYESALKSQAAPILTTYPSGLDGQASDNNHHQLAVELAKKHGTYAVELLWNGGIQAIAWSNREALCIGERLQHGVDLVLVPGDGLLGGPSCGIVLGKSHLIRELKEIGDRIGATASNSVLVGVQETLQVNESLERWSRSPIGAILTNGMDNLKNRADRMSKQITGSPLVSEVTMDTRDYAVGNQAWSQWRLPSTFLRIAAASGQDATLRKKLESMNPPIHFRSEGEAIILVVRTIDPADDASVVSAFWHEEPAASPTS